MREDKYDNVFEAPLDRRLKNHLQSYRDSFSMKTYGEENDDPDPLMDVFGITPERKRENRQYWGRELGMCWQLLVNEVLSHHCKAYAPPVKVGDEQPCDCCVGNDAIDTKYRIGSGDSKFQKNFAPNARLLKERGYQPVLLIVREDSLKSAISKARKSEWDVIQGAAAFDYVRDLSGIDLRKWLGSCRESGDFIFDSRFKF